MEEELKKALEILKAGGTILYPTDTVWGIGCDATNSKAVKKVYKIKKRIEEKSLIVLIDEQRKLESYLKEVQEVALDLIKSIDKPLTIIYPNAKNLAKNVIAKDGTVGIRIVKEEFCRQLIKLFDKPIVSTSANISGEESPAIFSKVSDKIINEVDYVVKLHQAEVKQLKPSTIIKLDESGEFNVIRN